MTKPGGTMPPASGDEEGAVESLKWEVRRVKSKQDASRTVGSPDAADGGSERSSVDKAQPETSRDRTKATEQAIHCTRVASAAKPYRPVLAPERHRPRN